MELLKSADRVVVIHANGTVSIQSPEDAIKEYEGKGFLDDFSDDGEEISDDGSQASCPTRHYTPPEPQRPIPTHLAPTGDLALYKYYLKSVSKSIFAVWLVVLVLLVVTEKGPGISIPDREHRTTGTLIIFLRHLHAAVDRKCAEK